MWKNLQQSLSGLGAIIFLAVILAGVAAWITLASAALPFFLGLPWVHSRLDALHGRPRLRGFGHTGNTRWGFKRASTIGDDPVDRDQNGAGGEQEELWACRRSHGVRRKALGSPVQKALFLNKVEQRHSPAPADEERTKVLLLPCCTQEDELGL